MHPMFQVSIDFNNHSSPNFCFENPRSHIVVLAKPKLQLVSSRSCRTYWNLEVSTRVARLESNHVPICKLHPLYFVTRQFWEKPSVFRMKTLLEHSFIKCPNNHTKKTLFWQPKWHLTGVEDFNIEQWPVEKSNSQVEEGSRRKWNFSEPNCVRGVPMNERTFFFFKLECKVGLRSKLSYYIDVEKRVHTCILRMISVLERFCQPFPSPWNVSKYPGCDYGSSCVICTYYNCKGSATAQAS